MAIPAPDACRESLRFPAGVDGFVGFHASSGRDLPFHCHDDLELNLVVAGSAAYDLPSGRSDLSSGVALWLHHGQVHRLAAQSRDFRMWVVVFRRSAQETLLRDCAPRAIPSLSRPLPSGGPARRLPDGDCRHLDLLMDGLRRITDDPHAFNAGLRYLAAAAWRAWGRCPDVPHGPARHPAVQSALRRLAADPSTSVAGLGGLSRSRLSRLFHEQTGETLIDHRRRLRVERFLALAGRDHARSLLTLALSAGFGSYAQFHRDFTRVTGSSPRQWAATRPAPHYR